MNELEKKLFSKLKNISPDSTPGFCLQVAHRGQKRIDIEWGKTWKYYDLASLTKIIFTTTQWMHFESMGIVNTKQKIQQYLPWYPFVCTGKELLSHSAGNEWWQPFYKQLVTLPNLYEKKQTLRALLRDAKPKSKNKTIYSDLDFFLLGFVLEDVAQMPLDVLWEVFLEQNMPNNKMHFNKFNSPRFARHEYAPTEKCLWRKRQLQGEVHDENTWSLEGVSSHAGLFGRAGDVLDWGLWLRQCLKGECDYIQSAVVRRFFKRAVPVARGDWSMGFMLPTKGNASCGGYFSATSVGHTGFTGTSFWMDLEKDLQVVLLSNRIYPSRKNELFRKERPRIHDAIVETLMEI